MTNVQSSAFSAPVEVVDLWKRSEVPSAALQVSPVSKTAVTERLAGSRSVLWTNLSQLAPSDQAKFFSKLSSQWPYSWERRAIEMPLHGSLLANCFCSALIASKINADINLFDPKAKFLDSVKKGPKAPLIFPIYISGFAGYFLHMTLITPFMFKEESPCTSCILSRNVFASLISGVILPLVTSPYLAYYVMLQRSENKFPQITKTQEFLALSYKGGIAAHPTLKYLIPFQVAIATAMAYIQIWGRNRIIDSMDADPELAKDVMFAAQTKTGSKEKILNFLRRIPGVTAVLETAPENERA